jgi:hypothetical protein
MSLFFFYLLCIFFYNMGAQEGRTGPMVGGGEVGTSGRGQMAGNRRVKTKMCKNVYICM